MNYINEEQFLKQPEKVQKAFLDWWQPSLGELFNYKHMLYCVDYVQGTVISPLNNNDVGIYTAFNKIECIPLLTEGQLREFIEDKTGSVVKLLQWHIENTTGFNRGYSIDIDLLQKNKYKVTHQFKNLGENLLQAYWKVACEIAKENKQDN